MKTVRYVLVQNEIRYLLSDKDDSRSKFLVKKDPSNKIFVDILEIANEDFAKLRLYYPDGNVVVGWTFQWEINRPVAIENQEGLFDGRFNVVGHIK